MTTKERIIRAFKDMARTQGFYAIRMEELATRAGITKKTVYSYFNSKEGLVEAVINSFMEEANHEVERITTKDALTDMIFHSAETIMSEWISIFNPKSLQDLQTYYPVTWERFQQSRIEFYDSVVEDIYSRTKREWLFEIDKRILREVFIAIQDRFLNQEFIVKMGITSEQMSSQMAILTTYPYW